MCKRSTKESILARFGVVFVKLRGCANQNGLIRALFFNHLMDSQKGQHQIQKHLLIFFISCQDLEK